jgi:predicted Zn finger-like uncharacterized protein
MRPYRPIPAVPAAAITPPTSCPSCRSGAIVTSTKVPDVDSYWRCTICGEVWNASRVRTNQPRERRWQ